ncbi:MAG: putative rane protein [Flaviaesturariibacter sp.]|nr:putative rane protein [Flaviaesturariibacter sp.]
MRVVLTLFLTAFAALAAAYYIDDILVAEFNMLLVVAVLVALLNTFLRQALASLSLSFSLLTMGLLLLLINAVFIKLADLVVEDFTVKTWSAAFLFGAVVTVVSLICQRLFRRRD